MKSRIAALIARSRIPKEVLRTPINPAPATRFRKVLRSLRRLRAKSNQDDYYKEKLRPRPEARLHQLEFINQRHIVLRRDKHRCKKCGRRQQQDVKGYHPDNLTVHHVYGWRHTEIKSLQTLCVACHICVPRGDAYWDWAATPAMDRKRISGVRYKLLE